MLTSTLSKAHAKFKALEKQYFSETKDALMSHDYALLDIEKEFGEKTSLAIDKYERNEAQNG